MLWPCCAGAPCHQLTVTARCRQHDDAGDAEQIATPLSECQSQCSEGLSTAASYRPTTKHGLRPARAVALSSLQGCWLGAVQRWWWSSTILCALVMDESSYASSSLTMGATRYCVLRQGTVVSQPFSGQERSLRSSNALPSRSNSSV